MGSPSGVSSYNPPLSDLGLEAFSRIQIRPGMLTPNHMRDLLSSAQLLLVEWSTKPDLPNLWKMQLNSVQLVQGTPSYTVPRNVVGILDYYVRQYQMGGPVNLTPVFSTVQNSPVVTITDPQSGAVPGAFISIGVPVAVGGLVLLGFYPVVSVIDPDHFTVTAASSATATVNNGGAVPVFTTVAGASSVNVHLANHGLYPQQNFAVQVPTQVDGVVLQGIYPVATVVDANNFTIVASVAGSPATASENGGQTQISISLPETPPSSQGYTDFVITPISRTEYADQPRKKDQARPTTVWWNRQIDSVLTMWPVPDQGPYTLFYWALVQIQDAALAGGTTLDLPYRFLEAFTAGLAAKLAEKYPPPPPNTIERLEARAAMQWQQVSSQDSEDVPLYITPALGSYFR
jgi:hypothetical protein